MSPTAITPDQFSTFGELLRHLRRQARLTQRELAIAVGYSDAQISRIEQNQRVPDAATITGLFVPALYLEDQPKWVARLLELARATAVDEAPRSEAMTALPTGTVTFLFTDIEGSTKLSREYPDAMPALLARHHEILKQCIKTHDGYAFQVVGDSFAVAFHSATDALNAALDAQRLLDREAWSPAPLKVRMGIHTGTAHLLDTSQVLRYSGYATLALTQRIMSAGHGGQILVSQSSYELARAALAENAQFVDLGEHRLKDALQPERIYQLTVPDLPSEFPPLNTIRLFNHNLPAQLTSFIGREKEIAEIKQAIEKDRLVTLTGPGGSGKTRLGLQVVTDLLAGFKDGVYFINLAPISDPNLVISTIAQTLDVKEVSGQPLLQSLKDYLHSKQFLLLLDNFEQVVSAAPLVAELLATCPQLKVLVTSREVLHLQGEHEFSVPPLDLPDPKHLPPLERLSQCEGVKLFTQRALAVKHDFAVTSENAPAIAEICYRLDGLPLAIELAAARIKLFAPPVLLSGLAGSPLRLLTGGARDLTARQQTLRNTIAWSYNLLDENEKMLFRQLAVFAGGFTLEAAQAVCNAASNLKSDVLEGVASLVDKSLLRQVEGVEGTPRFGMLETIRGYALEWLLVSEELPAAQRQHAHFFLALAEQAEPKLKRLEQKTWLDRLEIEHDNLRAALQWSQVSTDSLEVGLRLAGALFWFWYVQGYWSEGRQWLARVLTRTSGTAPAAQAKALCGAGALAFYQGDYIVARTELEESIMIFQEVGDKQGLALSLGYLGDVTSHQGDDARAMVLLEEGLATFQEVGDRWGIAIWLKDLGLMALHQGDDARAMALLEESVAIFREVGDKQATARSLLGLGAVVRHQGDDARAMALYEESLMLCQALGHKRGTSLSLLGLATVARHQGHNGQATALCEASLMLNRELGDKLGIVWCLEELAGVAGAQGQPRRAAQLFGAAEALFDTTQAGSSHSHLDSVEYERIVSSIRAQLDEQTFAAAWEEGKNMTLEQAVEYALEESHE